MRTSKNGTVLKLISSAQITLSKIYDAYTINLSNSNFDIVCNDQGDALAGEIGANGRAITTTSVVMGTKKLTAVASNPTAEQYCISISEQVGCTAAKNGNDKIYINTLSNSIAGKFSISFNIEGTTTVVKDVVFVKKINDAPNFIDGQFSFGTGYWSATPDGTGVLGANVTIKKSNEATYGTNLLEIANDTWVYSKKYIDIEKDRIYRCRFRAKQSIDNTIGNKIAYFGYTPYNSSGTAIGTDGSNNMYFASGTLKINTWTEWEYYVSTKARAEISTTVNGVKKIITPAIQAFPTGAVKFKPMFIVNFNQGNGIALVDGWILEDVTEKIEVSQLEYKASQIETTVNGIDANVISIKTYTDMSSNPMTLAAKANYSAYDTPNQGEVYLHGLNDKRNPADIDGKCIWNTKTVSLPKVMFNPNSIVPDGVPVYMVRNIADNKWWSVWKETNDSIITWKRALADVNISSTIYTHTWNEANDIVVGYYVIKKTNPRNREASIVIAQLFDGALNYKQATSMTLVGSISQLEILESEVNLKVANTDNKISQLKLEADKITQRVQSTENTITNHTTQLGQVDNKIHNAINSLQIGGKNYVLKSDYYITDHDYANFDFSILQELRGKTVTVSVEVDLVNAQGTRVGFEPSIRYADGTIQYFGVWQYINSPTTMKKRISFTHTILDKEIISYDQRGIYIQGVVSGTARIGRPKLEIGNQATDWTPAPEDIDSSIRDVDTKVESTKNKIAELELTTDSITQKVQSTENNVFTVTNKFDNLQIGGRNLFKGHNDKELTLNNYGDTGSFTQFRGYFTFDPAEYVNKEFTISFYAKSPNGSTALQLYNSNDNPRYFYFWKQLDNNLNNEWKYYTYTFTNIDRGVDFHIDNKIEIYAPQQMGVMVKQIKIEEGNKATSWTPAPEDTNDAISNVDSKLESTRNKVAEIVTSLDGINLKVQSTEQTVTNHTTQLSQVDGKIDNAKSQAIINSRLHPDTRNTNENPLWYMNNYPCQTITEFKIGSNIGLAGVGFGTVETKVPWTDPSGGYPVQTFRSSATPTYERKGATFTEWGDWVQVEDIHGSQNKANVAQNNANAYTNGQITAVNQTISDRVAEIKLTTDSITQKVSKTEQLAMIAQHSKMLYTDPTFKDGYNGVNIYNNNGNGAVSVSRIAKSDDCPTTSGYMLEIATNGDAVPYSGGFFFGNQVRPNAIFVTRIIAKLPEGSEIVWLSNSIGNEGQGEWLTETRGTGKWTEYVLKVTCGTTGNFHNTNFFALICPSNPVTWHVAFATVFDVTETSNIESRISSAEQKITDSAIINTVTNTINNTVNSAVNELQVGGRNYCAKTNIASLYSIDSLFPVELDRNNIDCPNGFSVVGNINVRGAIRLPYVINKNGYWTVSFDVRGIQNTPVGFWVDICDLNSTHIVTTGDNTWKRVSVTTNVTNYSSNVYHFVDFADFAWAHFQIRNIKIEEGNKATDYTPAPEDIDSAINDVNNKVTTATKELAELKITSNSITQRVESSEQLINNKEDKNSRYIFARGTGCDYLAPSYVEIQGACVTNGQGRGLRIHALNPETLSCFFIQDYDTFESDNAVNLFNAKINELNAGNHIIIVTSYDAAYPWKCKDALRSIGGSLLPDTHDTYREAYALIGKSKLGQGNGVEMYIPKTATDQRYAEVSVKIGPKGEFAGVNHSNSVSQIEILKNNIDLKVQKNNVISSINLYTQDDENGGHSGVKIRGDKIDLQGQVTFSSLADSNVAGSIKNIFAQQDNQTVINGGMIKTHTIKGNDLLLKGNMSVTDNSGNKTFEITDAGEVNIQARSLRIGSSNVATNNDIDVAVSNIQSGGNNLAIGTDKANGDVYEGHHGSPYIATDLFGGITAITTSTAWSGRYFNLKAIAQRGGFKVGDNLVLSVYIKSDQNVTLNVTSHRTTSTGNTAGSSKAYNNFTVTPKWQQVWFPFTADEGSLSREDTRIEVNQATGANAIHWAGWKLEKGTKPTDWTPATQDINTALNKKVDNTQEAIFNKLFANGQQGFVLENGRVYINGEYIKANTINGSTIKAGTLDASKIKTGIIQASTGGSYFNLNNGSMLLGTKSSYNNYLEWTGSSLNIKSHTTTLDSSGLTIKNGALSIWDANNNKKMVYLGNNGNIVFAGDLRMELPNNKSKYVEFKAVPYSTDIGCKLILSGNTLNNSFSIETPSAVQYFWVNKQGTYVSNNLYITSDSEYASDLYTQVNFDDGLVYPRLDNKGQLGQRNNRWKYLYAVTGVLHDLSVNHALTAGDITCDEIYCIGDIACDELSCTGNVKIDGRRAVVANGTYSSQQVKGLAVRDGSSSKYLEVQTFSGSAYGVNLNVSDRNMKENVKKIAIFNDKINPLNDHNKIGLEAVMSLEHYEFDYKEEGLNHVDCGYIAQQLKEVNSNFAYNVKQENDEDLYCPDMTALMPNLSMAIQQQQQYIQKLELRIEELEKVIDKLRA